MTLGKSIWEVQRNLPYLNNRPRAITFLEREGNKLVWHRQHGSVPGGVHLGKLAFHRGTCAIQLKYGFTGLKDHLDGTSVAERFFNRASFVRRRARPNVPESGRILMIVGVFVPSQYLLDRIQIGQCGWRRRFA